MAGNFGRIPKGKLEEAGGKGFTPAIRLQRPFNNYTEFPKESQVKIINLSAKTLPLGRRCRRALGLKAKKDLTFA